MAKKDERTIEISNSIKCTTGIQCFIVYSLSMDSQNSFNFIVDISFNFS